MFITPSLYRCFRYAITQITLMFWRKWW